MWRTRNQDFYYEFPVASCKEFSQVSGLAGAELDSQRLTPVLFANCLVIGACSDRCRCMITSRNSLGVLLGML